MKRGLKTYKYSCKDTSPFSNYFMHPFWNWISQLYPLWLAPNVLTFAGFLLTVAHYFLLSFFSPHFHHPELVPLWAWMVTSIFVFVAHTLDGTDGKQARRTNSSSPLGELLDHGCDSWVCLFLPGSLFTLLSGAYSHWELFIGQWIILLSFVIPHWEKYITGVLFLPWSYDISLISVAVVFLLAFIYSPTVFYMPMVCGISAATIIKHILYASVYLVHVPFTVWNLGSTRLPTQPWHRGLGVYGAFRPLLPILLLFVSSTTWAFHSQGLLRFHARLFLSCFSTVVSNVTLRFIVAQLCRVDASIHNTQVYYYSILTMLCCFILPTSKYPDLELGFLYVITLVAVFDHIYYAVRVVNEFADTLDISVFRISLTDPYKQMLTRD